MSAGELAILLAAVLCSIGFAALVVVLMRVLDSLSLLRREITDLRAETRPLLQELRESTDIARDTVDIARQDLERFDRVLGSAEAIGDAVASSGRVARTAFSVPVIKIAGIATGGAHAIRRIRGTKSEIEIVTNRRTGQTRKFPRSGTSKQMRGVR
jgi:hypothetical protein